MVWSGKCWRLTGAWVIVCALTIGVACAADVPDTLQQRVAACSSCHGKHGQGGRNGFNPRLAGKPVLYLYHQLLNFREGRRHYPMMRHMVDGLPDVYLREIAEYFAAQEPVWPRPEPSSLSAALLDKGRNLVRHGDQERDVPACQACHGKRLTGLDPAIPPLVGLPANYISNQLGAWRGGSRHGMAPDCMAKVAARLTPQQIAAVAGWLSSQPTPDNTQPAAAGSLQLPLECGGMKP